MDMKQDFYINSLKGQYLIATPGMQDPQFANTVIYLCAHTMQGAMGLIINNPLKTLTFTDVLQQLNIAPHTNDIFNIFLGGPVETSRGIVLHSSEYQHDSTIDISETTKLTATLDIIKDINNNQGPEKFLFALGFASWSAGQLEQELKTNTWLNLQSNDDLIFNSKISNKWETALQQLHISPARFSPLHGNA